MVVTIASISCSLAALISPAMIADSTRWFISPTVWTYTSPEITRQIFPTPVTFRGRIHNASSRLDSQYGFAAILHKIINRFPTWYNKAQTSQPAPCFHLLGQIERPDQEHSHLVAAHRQRGAVISTATPARDALIRQLFDPGRRPVIVGHVAE